MRTVIFPTQMDSNGVYIYPAGGSQFYSNVVFVGDSMVADYTGADTSLEDFKRIWLKPPTLNVSLTDTMPAIDEDITATFTVFYKDNSVATHVTASYMVPILRMSDGVQEQFFDVSVVNGVGSVTFSLPKKGSYELILELIDPLPMCDRMTGDYKITVM